MIVYQKAPQLRLERLSWPQPPFWAATVLSPYSGARSSPLAIDYTQLRAYAVTRPEVSVCESVEDQMERSRTALRPPILIDATGAAEKIYHRGDAIRHDCHVHGLGSLLLLSSPGELPREVLTRDSVVVIAAWPLEFDLLHSLFAEARAVARWGVLVPVLYPLTTRLDRLEPVADIARENGAAFLASATIELDPPAKHVIAESYSKELDDETYQTLFHADLETITLATERHIASLANERSMADFVLPPEWERRSNWNAAVALTLCATRMIRMNHDVETGWHLQRSARVVAALNKSLETIASAASLSIIEGLHPLAADALTHWIQSGSSELFDDVNRKWRLRRDYGIDPAPEHLSQT